MEPHLSPAKKHAKESWRLVGNPLAYIIIHMYSLSNNLNSTPE
jgi:hypothetical protein